MIMRKRDRRSSLLVVATIVTVVAVAPAANAAYSVDGYVWDSISGSGVSGALVRLSSGGSSNTTTTNSTGWYTTGWSSGNMVNQTMNLYASKDVRYGSTSWVCTSSTETGKNVTIYPGIAVDPSLEFQPAAQIYSGVGVQSPNDGVSFVDAGTYMEVQSFSATLAFETGVMEPVFWEPLPPFDWSSSWFVDSGSGTLHIEAAAEPGVVVVLGDEANPTPLHRITWEVISFTEGQITTVEVVDCEMITSTGPTNPVHHVTQYLLSSGVVAAPPPDWETSSWGRVKDRYRD